jgi:hypothetical protein
MVVVVKSVATGRGRLGRLYLWRCGAAIHDRPMHEMAPDYLISWSAV